MIVSATFMLFILKGIDSVRTRSAAIGPGGFNSLIQTAHGINDYAVALEQYRFNIGNGEEQQRWAKEYKSEFEILWGNLNHFTLRSPQIGSIDNLLSNFRHDAQQFLEKTESTMSVENTLDADQVTIVLDDLAVNLSRHINSKSGQPVQTTAIFLGYFSHNSMPVGGISHTFKS